MRIDIMTLFPQQITAVMGESIIGRAMEKGLVEINAVNIRDFSADKHSRVDDTPYGGGNGMVLMLQPLLDCHKSLKKDNSYTILMSPAGNVFTQSKAIDLLKHEHLILVCGHYEGLDQRFIDLCVDEEISIGDFVLTGGELPAMVVSDAICRMIPNVLSSEECFTDESHFSGTLEYPQYTKPQSYEGLTVPEVLLSGHHANINKWRRQKSLEKTKRVRPDMFSKLTLSKEDKKLID